MRRMTPEEEEQFRKEHPLRTTIIIGKRPVKSTPPSPKKDEENKSGSEQKK